jgi:nitric oxide reductase NorQ protein
VKLASAIRKLDGATLREVSSTRTLISTALLVRAGLAPHAAATAAMLLPLTDDADVRRGLSEVIATYLPE